MNGTDAATRHRRTIPQGQINLPFSGRSATARSCSMKAAVAAAADRAVKTNTVLRVIREARDRGLTRHDVRDLTAYAVNSICPMLTALRDAGLIVEQGSRVSGPWSRDCTIYVAHEYRLVG